MGAFRAEEGRRRPSLLVFWAPSVEVTIRPALAVYHGLPSLRGEGLILSGELIQHPGTAGEEGTRPLPDRKHYMIQESEAFNELWGEPIRVRCRPYIIAPVYLRSLSGKSVKRCLGSTGSESQTQISIISCKFQAFSQLSACPRPESVEKCRSHGKLFNFHEDKQDNGICSANWISRTVRLLEEVCCLSWFSRGNTNHCIFPIITPCWSGKETCSTNRPSM